MIETLFIGGIISLLIVAAAAFLLLRVVRQELTRLQGQQQSWTQTHETQQQHWKSSQEKRLSDLEHRLSVQLQEFQMAQRAREAAENQRFDALIDQYETTSAKARLEYALQQLPRVEDIPLPGQDQRDKQGLAVRHTPPNLQGADLSGRDLSSRYLSHADLRDIRLARAKLFMADLSWANLASADLNEAELSAANLTHANLRGASLRGANFLVADLQHAILIGADLRDAHSLSLEQVKTTLYDATTQFDPDIASQLPQKKRSQQLVDHRPMPARSEDTARMPTLRKSQELQTPTGDVIVLQQATAIPSRDQASPEQSARIEIPPPPAPQPQITTSEASHPAATLSDANAHLIVPVNTNSSIETSPVPIASSISTKEVPVNNAPTTNTANDDLPANNVPVALDTKNGLTAGNAPTTNTANDNLPANNVPVTITAKDDLLADNETEYTIVPFHLTASEEPFQDRELSEKEETRTPELADSN